MFLMILLGVVSNVLADVFVTPKKWKISPGETQEIYIDNYSSGRDYVFYHMNVTRPDGSIDTLWGPTSSPYVVHPGDRLTIKYPDDFLSPPSGWTSTGTGSTAKAGTYHVTVVGRTLNPFDVNTEWDVTSFSAVPEFLFSSMTLLSIAFAGAILLKRRSKIL